MSIIKGKIKPIWGLVWAAKIGTQTIFLFIILSFFCILAEKSAWAMIENSLIAQGSSDEIEMLNERINNNPNDSEAFLKRGAIYAYNEEYEKAIEDYNQALNLDPNNALTYNYRGTAYYWLLNYQKALEDYNQAIDLNPDLAVAYYNRGYVHQKLENIEKAIEDFQQGAELSLKQGDTTSYQEALEMINNLQKGKI